MKLDKIGKSHTESGWNGHRNGREMAEETVLIF